MPAPRPIHSSTRRGNFRTSIFLKYLIPSCPRFSSNDHHNFGSSRCLLMRKPSSSLPHACSSHMLSPLTMHLPLPLPPRRPVPPPPSPTVASQTACPQLPQNTAAEPSTSLFCRISHLQVVDSFASTNLTCVCTSTAFQQIALRCLQQECTPQDVATATQMQEAACGGCK